MPRPRPVAERMDAPGTDRPPRAGVLVLHAWWGRIPDVTDHADRLAAAGYAVVAPDLFAGATAATVAEAEVLAGGADPAVVAARASAGLDALAARLPPGAPIATLGFSFGAQEAAALPGRDPRVVATVLYYGTAWGPEVEAARAPILAHMAAEDPFEPEEAIAGFADALGAAGRPLEIVRYPGTGHWFAEPSRPAWRPAAAEEAWLRTLAFLRAHLGHPAGG